MMGLHRWLAGYWGDDGRRRSHTGRRRRSINSCCLLGRGRWMDCLSGKHVAPFTLKKGYVYLSVCYHSSSRTHSVGREMPNFKNAKQPVPTLVVSDLLVLSYICFVHIYLCTTYPKQVCLSKESWV